MKQKSAILIILIDLFLRRCSFLCLIQIYKIKTLLKRYEFDL